MLFWFWFWFWVVVGVFLFWGLFFFVCTHYFFLLLFKLIPACLQVQAGGSTKFNRDPYLHKIIHTSELFSLERRKEKELEALSLPHLTRYRVELLMPAPSLPAVTQEG